LHKKLFNHHEGHEDPEGFFFMSFMRFMVKKAVSLSIKHNHIATIMPFIKNDIFS